MGCSECCSVTSTEAALGADLGGSGKYSNNFLEG